MAKFLICDDSQFMRMMLKKMLVAKGHEVLGEASNGKEAVAMFKKLRPDIVTMDITMPEIDGIGAVRLIREEDCLARIIMITAIGQKEIVKEALMAGAADFVVKPFEEEQVFRIVNKILEHNAG
jgi:two-component system chemotaxis response regulator CheY